MIIIAPENEKNNRESSKRGENQKLVLQKMRAAFKPEVTFAFKFLRKNLQTPHFLESGIRKYIVSDKKQYLLWEVAMNCCKILNKLADML